MCAIQLQRFFLLRILQLCFSQYKTIKEYWVFFQVLVFKKGPSTNDTETNVVYGPDTELDDDSDF